MPIVCWNILATSCVLEHFNNQLCAGTWKQRFRMKNTSEEIIYRRDSARSQKQLLPSLSQVDDVHLYVYVLKVHFRED